MIEIPINQTWFKIDLDTEQTEETFQNTAAIEMKFRSPDGEVTTVTAQRVAGTSRIEYSLPLNKTVLNKIGKWAVWDSLTAIDGRVAPSKKAITIQVIKEGTTTP